MKERQVIQFLLLGVYDNDQLQFVGKVGTGFTDKLAKGMMKCSSH